MPSLTETIAIAMEQAARGRIAQAMDDLRKQLTTHPDSADLHESLGILAMRTGQLDQGLYHFEKAAGLGRPRADYLSNYGTALNMKGRTREAAEQFRKAVQLAPTYFPAQLGLGSSLIGTGDYAGAIEAGRQAAALAPARPEPWNNLALALLSAGRSGEAVATLHQALATLRDHPLLLNVLVQSLNYRPEADPASVLEEHARLGRVLAQLGGGLYPTFDNPDPERPLRIGYLSHEFRDHPLVSFVEPILQNHSAGLEVHCYAAGAAPDATTRRLQKLVKHWTDISRMGDEQIERAVRGDRIDILVDLSGHSTGSRVSAFARRLAPVQISYLGYPNTTGLKDMDYRIVDGRTDPEGAESPGTEKLLRLEGCAYCWKPAGAAPAPARRDGPAVFGSFASAAAMNEATVEAWARVLKEAPGSRLVLRNTALGGAAIRDWYASEFEKHGVGADRLDMAGAAGGGAGGGDGRDAYASIDVALDPFPCSALATTCQALGAGVPVVTLEGRTHAGRRGASVLAAAGLGELVATSVDGYVSTAAGLAKDAARLGALRASLAERVRKSPLCDGAGFTKKLEGAYRGAWRAWCARQ